MGDSMARSLLRAFAGLTHRNLAAWTVAGALVALAVLVPHWATRYGAALAVFCIWMAWFVETLAGWLGEDESGPAAASEPFEAGDAPDR